MSAPAPDGLHVHETVPPLTIVAVHGNGGGGFRFSRVTPCMPADARLVAVTLPGFADAPRDASLRTMADYADHLAGLLAGERRPRVLLGHGIGGSIALDLAQRHAGLLDGLILHAPVGTRLDRRWLPRLMALPGARAAGRRAFASWLLRPLWRRLLFSPAVPAAIVDRFFDEYGRCSVFGQMFDVIAPAWFRSLRPVAVPSALLWGEDERVLTVDQLEDFRTLLPGAIIRRVPGWGHFPMLEHPAEYAAEVAAIARALTETPHPPPRCAAHISASPTSSPSSARVRGAARPPGPAR